jgi:chemotaxis protein methyltransferase CheR
MMPTGDELARFTAAIAARLGLRVEADRAAELIERRAALHREPVAAYLARVGGDPAERAEPAEIAALVDELTVGETYFLRHIEQFRAFAESVVPERVARGRLAVLSAGCSSGEEPYTLAMLLGEAYPHARFTIHGVDINTAAIARARAARYSRWSLRATTPAFEQRWFRSDGRELVVVPEIRAAVTFESGNVLDGDALAGRWRWDVVFCRNVMMYFSDEQADALIARISRALAPGGYLFLGHAETLRGRSDEFSLCHSHGAFYYQRHPASTGEVMPAVAPAALDTGWYEDIRAATQRVQAIVAALDAPAVPASTSPDSEPPATPDLGEVRELLAQERFGEALERLDRLDQLCGRRLAPGADHETAVLRALVLTHAGRFAEARAACGELLATDATSAGASYLMALCCEGDGDPEGAARMARRAAELDPSFAMPRVHLGLLARRIGDRAIASSELTRAIALLEREAPARLALYGGGFSRQSLLAMCRAELAAIGAAR